MASKSKTAKKAGKQHASEVTFVCDLKPEARQVYLAGDFNGWDPTADRVQKQGGRFLRKMQLAPGEHQYKFVIDGEWHADPAAGVQVPNDCGTTNSVVRV